MIFSEDSIAPTPIALEPLVRAPSPVSGTIDGFFFDSPARILASEGDSDQLSAHGTTASTLAHRAVTALEGSGRSATLLGVIPLQGAEAARLFVPRLPTRCEPPRRTASGLPQVATAALASDEPASAEERHFLRIVRAAVASIQAGELTKVVLSRALSLELGRAPSVAAILAALRQREPNAYHFAVSTEGGATLLGASPELLVSRTGMSVLSRPLAGSTRRSADAAEDRGRAAALLRSPKDRHEHSLVVERIADTLQPFLADLTHDAEPSVVATSSMWHLATELRGKLKSDSTTALELALSLHPTPAVCGTPTRAARDFILQHELEARGDFTGALGYMDHRGDGEWVLALRCAELYGTRARVFAGAGIVATSDPLSELYETRGKMQTMLEALGLLAGDQQ